MHSLKKYIANKQEIIYFFLTVLVLSFILSFTKWGDKTFDFAIGLRNFFITFIIVGLSLLIKLLVQKYFSRKAGFQTEFKPWLTGLLLGFLFAFATNGRFVFLAVGALTFTLIGHVRVGKYEQMSHSFMGWLSLTGILACLFIALFAKVFMLNPVFSKEILSTIITANLWIVFYSMLPLPLMDGLKKTGTSDGLKLLFYSHVEYLTVAVLIALSMISILFFSAGSALKITIFSLIVIYGTYFFFYRQNLPSEKTKKKAHYLP